MKPTISFDRLQWQSASPRQREMVLEAMEFWLRYPENCLAVPTRDGLIRLYAGKVAFKISGRTADRLIFESWEFREQLLSLSDLPGTVTALGV